MAQVRRRSKGHQKRDDSGKKLCLVCTGPMPKRRSSYCSDECWIRNTPGMIRGYVERRDKGICAKCGIQCASRDVPWNEHSKYPRWEADHIVPVAEGGGLCGIDGYRTLCLPCHKQASAELAARLALKRRIEAEADGGLDFGPAMHCEPAKDTLAKGDAE